MPLFSYNARNNQGEAIKGVLEANSSDAVATQLLDGGLIPIHIDLAVNKVDTTIDFEKLFPKKVKTTEIIQFSRQMHTLLKAGVPILSTLAGIANSMDNPTFSQTLKAIILDLESGRDLATCLSQHPNIFSLFYVSMVRIGETTGKLDTIFLELARNIQRDLKTSMQINRALRYPQFVMVAIVIALVIINIFVIPTFAKVFEQSGTELPWMTQLLITVSTITVNYWKEMLFISIAGFFGLRYYLATDDGRLVWDKRKLSLPVVGKLIHQAVLARFARLFALSSNAGVPIITSLTIVARALDNCYMEAKVLGMQEGIERGDTISRTASSTGMFDALVLQMITIGEVSGSIDELLKEVAAYYEMEVDYEIERLSASIEPILTIFIGMIVLVLALGVFLPMWDMSSVAMRK